MQGGIKIKVCLGHQIVLRRPCPGGRAGARAADLGGRSVYHEGPKFEIKHKSRRS